jgi:hypothetical protein
MKNFNRIVIYVVLSVMLLISISVLPACGVHSARPGATTQRYIGEKLQEEIAQLSPKIQEFKSDQYQIFSGENATLTWSVIQADNITIDQGIGSVDTYSKQSMIPSFYDKDSGHAYLSMAGFSGTYSFIPSSSATYTLTIANKYGKSTKTARVEVMQEDQAPKILFEITPAKVKAGLLARMEWSVYAARTISVDNGIGVLSEMYGEKLITPKTATYTLTATNKAGTSTKSVTIEVIPADAQ